MRDAFNPARCYKEDISWLLKQDGLSVDKDRARAIFAEHTLTNDVYNPKIGSWMRHEVSEILSA